MSSSLPTSLHSQPQTHPNPFARGLSALRRFWAILVIETPARLTGYDRLIARLEKSGAALEKHIRATSTGGSAGRAANRAALAHIVGIERWGQRRLRVALGEPPLGEEYDDYRPTAQDWPALLDAFRAARRETISLGRSLRMAGIDPQTRIPHNHLGEISLLGWLYYLNLHARIESWRIY